MAVMNPILQAINKADSKTEFAKICGVTRPAVEKWIIAGRLPRTDWTGETNYSEKIYKAFGVVVPPFKESA